MFNLWPQVSLFNSAFGEVYAIIYTPDKPPPNMPAYILIKFDKLDILGFDDTKTKGLVPIFPIEISSNSDSSKSRTWFYYINIYLKWIRKIGFKIKIYKFIKFSLWLLIMIPLRNGYS